MVDIEKCLECGHTSFCTFIYDNYLKNPYKGIFCMGPTIVGFKSVHHTLQSFSAPI